MGVNSADSTNTQTAKAHFGNSDTSKGSSHLDQTVSGDQSIIQHMTVNNSPGSNNNQAAVSDMSNSASGTSSGGGNTKDTKDKQQITGKQSTVQDQTISNSEGSNNSQNDLLILFRVLTRVALCKLSKMHIRP